LRTESKHDRVIEDAAFAAVRREATPSSRPARP